MYAQPSYKSDTRCDLKEPLAAGKGRSSENIYTIFSVIPSPFMIDNPHDPEIVANPFCVGCRPDSDESHLKRMIRNSDIREQSFDGLFANKN